MEVERFRGKYVEADDANQYIDMASIYNTISDIRKEIERLENIESGIDSSSNNLRKENLSFFVKDMEEDVVVMRETIKDNINKLNNYIEILSNETNEALNKKQIELNEFEEKREREEEEMHMEEQSRMKDSEEGAMIHE